MSFDTVLSFNANLLALLVAAVAAFMIGGIWYSPVLFSKAFMQHIGKSEAELRAGAHATMYLGLFVGWLVAALILANLVQAVGANGAIESAQVGFWVWCGFALTSALGPLFFEMRSKHLFLINQGYNLVAMLAMGAILGAWK